MRLLWNRTEEIIVGTFGVAALAISMWQVLVRYAAFPNSLQGGDELAVYLIVWAMLLSSSGIVARNGHIRAELLTPRLPRKLAFVIEVFTCVLALVFCLGLTWFGYLITADSLDFGERSLSALRFPMWIYFAALPVSAMLMSLRYLIRIIALLRTGSESEFATVHDEVK